VGAGALTLVDDLQAMLALEQELWRSHPRHVQATYGQLAWWSANLPHGETEARLWRDGDRLTGWGWTTGGTELEFQVRPEQRDLLDEILAWAQPDEVWVRGDDDDARRRLEAHGLVHDPGAPWMRRNARSLHHVPEPSLADGYRVRTVRDEDFASRAAAHRSAFHPSRLRDDVYELVRTMVWYRQDLDCVVEAPDGSIAAYTLAWLDEQNRVGELEPVGTHADHRRLGLGRAVNLFALRRLREERATTALVACRGDSAYPIPCKLYESVGFRAVGRTIAYRRADVPGAADARS
jgi:ribosomal protein S18 acetylase RimI-like enzyme